MVFQWKTRRNGFQWKIHQTLISISSSILLDKYAIQPLNSDLQQQQLF